MSVAPPLPDPELQAEQDYLEGAMTSLAAMRERAERLLQDLIAAGNPDLDYVAALSRRVALLADSPRPLLFGRIDEETGGTWHIGRRHVEDKKSDPVVVFCAYGFHVGCKTAIALREAGFDAKYMKGGHSAWKAIGGPIKLYT